YGPDRLKVKDQKKPFILTRRRLYSYDDLGGYNCPAGYLPRILDHYAKTGIHVDFEEQGVWADPKRTARLTPCWENLAGFAFRPRQRECLEAIARQIEYRLGGTIDAAPAFGKTFLFPAVALLYPDAHVSIAVKSLDLVKRTAEVCKKYERSTDVVHGAVKVDPRSRVLIYSADSLHRHRDDSDIDLFDECHELVADNYLALIGQNCVDALRFGFSGSLRGRADGNEAAYEPIFGPTIFQITVRECEDLGLRVPIVVNWNKVHAPDNPVLGLVRKDSIKRHGIWRHKARNAAIALRAQAYRPDEQVLILVDTLDHALRLRR